MPLTIPPSAPFQGALIPRPALWRGIAPEGDKFLSMEIDWSEYPTDTVAIALTGGATTVFSRICALSVDNNRNGNDVVFLFPDSGYELVVPALSGGVFPVWTNGLMFYAQSANTTSGDITVVNVLNYVPPPVALQSSQAQSSANAGSISPATAGLTTLVAAGNDGTVESVYIAGTLTAGASGGVFDGRVQDGNASVIARITFELADSASYLGPLLSLGNNMQVRFVNGLFFNIAQAVNGGEIAVNVLYRGF